MPSAPDSRSEQFMNIKFFREKIVELRKWFTDISDSRANAIWNEFKDIAEERFTNVATAVMFEGRFTKDSSPLERLLRNEASVSPEVCETINEFQEPLQSVPPGETNTSTQSPKELGISQVKKIHECENGLFFERDLSTNNIVVYRCWCVMGSPYMRYPERKRG